MKKGFSPARTERISPENPGSCSQQAIPGAASSRTKKGRKTLSDYVDVPDVCAAGRLDYDSEGLVILIDSGRMQHFISDYFNKLPKTYLV